MNPIYAALILDTLNDDFPFDWESAFRTIQSMKDDSTLDELLEFDNMTMPKDHTSQMQESQCKEPPLSTKPCEFLTELHSGFDHQYPSSTEIPPYSSLGGRVECVNEYLQSTNQSVEVELTHLQRKKRSDLSLSET